MASNMTLAAGRCRTGCCSDPDAVGGGPGSGADGGGPRAEVQVEPRQIDEARVELEVAGGRARPRQDRATAHEDVVHHHRRRAGQVTHEGPAAQAIDKAIAPLGVGVVIEARHMCMVMRGVEKQHSQAVTSAMLGEFRKNQQTREEVLALIGRK